jgi:hypothetical protein
MRSYLYAHPNPKHFDDLVLTFFCFQVSEAKPLLVVLLRITQIPMVFDFGEEAKEIAGVIYQKMKMVCRAYSSSSSSPVRTS